MAYGDNPLCISNIRFSSVAAWGGAELYLAEIMFAWEDHWDRHLRVIHGLNIPTSEKLSVKLCWERSHGKNGKFCQGYAILWKPIIFKHINVYFPILHSTARTFRGQLSLHVKCTATKWNSKTYGAGRLPVKYHLEISADIVQIYI